METDPARFYLFFRLNLWGSPMRNLAPTLIGACALALGASTAASAIPLTSGMGAGGAAAAKTDPVTAVHYRYYTGGYYYRPYRYYRPWRYTYSYPAYYGYPSGAYAYAGYPTYYSSYSYPYYYSYPRYRYYRPAFGLYFGW
jgi:hypothetical protein